MSQMGHTSSALALEIYAKKMERSRDTGARMDALVAVLIGQYRALTARMLTRVFPSAATRKL
jgi:hypothetical protein